MQTQLKLCMDCRFLGERGKCHHESAVTVDYVTGNHRKFDAQIHRTWKDQNSCGPNAKFFEAKNALVVVS